jgi:AcrR family transcriptional regulator
MKQRARNAEDKAVRRTAILKTARAMFAKARFEEIKMSDVAERSGLAKGTVFLYFPTKEALFLDLVEEDMGDWIGELVEAFEAGGRWSAARVARIFAETLSARPAFTRLLPLIDNVLETNVSVKRIVDFKLTLLRRMAQVALLLEKRLDWLKPGEGAPLLLRIYALLVGLRQISDPCAAAEAAMEDPRLAPLQIDFDGELEAGLTALLLGHSPIGRSS